MELKKRIGGLAAILAAASGFFGLGGCTPDNIFNRPVPLTHYFSDLQSWIKVEQKDGEYSINVKKETGEKTTIYATDREITHATVKDDFIYFKQLNRQGKEVNFYMDRKGKNRQRVRE